jgi:phospholipid-binding lipoprotein MlaA
VINDGSTKIGLSVLQLVNTRASLLGATTVIDEISLDKYTFVRDAYLQRRRSLVFDGDAPASDEPQSEGGPAGDALPAVGGAASAPPASASAPSGGASAPRQ